MEKKIKFSDKGTVQKIVYLTVIAILCVSAIVIGIVASNGRKTTDGNIQDGTAEQPGTEQPNETPDETPDGGQTEQPDTPAPKLAFVSPAVGTVMKSHSATVPVFSQTLDEWRIHTGIDISTEEGASVVASEAGEVSAVYNHPMHGATVEIKHSENHKSVYRNLDADKITVKVGDKVNRGDVIACVGDSTVIEIADEPHLHFEVKLADEAVNPLDYMSEDTKKDGLGITEV